MADETQKFTPSSRKKKKQADEVSNADSESSTSITPEDDDMDTEAVASSIDDGLPHPRVSFTK